MEFNFNSICNDLLVIPLEDGLIDISWAIDTEKLKEEFIKQSITKILNFQDNVDFNIEIDSVNTFDSINLQQFKFSEIEKTYRGNIVFSAIVPFNKNKFEETNYFLRIKIDESSIVYNIIKDEESQESITINDSWSNTLEFTIPKNYTKDLVESMYKMVADFNAYNKEAKSANMYYIFQAIATQLNQEFTYIEQEKNKKFINKALPDSLVTVFGELFKFNNAYGISMEEYRRIIKNLILGYQNGGAWNYISETLKYLIGYKPELFTLQNFYPWILRHENKEYTEHPETQTPIPDPDWNVRNYYNPLTNFYLYYENDEKVGAIYNIDNQYLENRNINKNLIMMTDENTRKFTFIVKSTNFFNRYIDSDKISTILDLLKSVYTKYSLNLESYIESSI
jgi:hypothetical protein